MFLMVENPGVCDVEAFTIVGVSTTRYSDHTNTIGKFGSGTKQAICVLLRAGLTPVIYSGNLRLEFFTKMKFVRGVDGGREYKQVCMSVSGKDGEGRQVKRTEDCGFVVEMGEMDWTEVAMGLREMVSNALDAANQLNLSMETVKIEAVPDNKVRAKSGYTRFFILYTPEVSRYHQNITDNFLHFTHGQEAYENQLMVKQERGPAKIFRVGVKVGEANDSCKTSIFDYNLRDCQLDESRNLKRGTGKSEAAKLLRNAPVSHLKHLFGEIGGLCVAKTEDLPFEATIDRYDLNPDWHHDSPKQKENWKTAWIETFGDTAVAAHEQHELDILRNKGFKPIAIQSEGIYNTLKLCGVATAQTVLTGGEQKGYAFSPPCGPLLRSFDRIWTKLHDLNLTAEKSYPILQQYECLVSGGAIMNGFYELGSDKISIRADLANGEGGALDQVILEEIGHYVSGGTDGSVDFERWLVKVSVTLLGKPFPEKSA